MNENNSIAYTQADGAQNENTQNTSVYTSDNLVPVQEIQTQNNLLHSDENTSNIPVNLQKDFTQNNGSTSNMTESSQTHEIQRDLYMFKVHTQPTRHFYS